MSTNQPERRLRFIKKDKPLQAGNIQVNLHFAWKVVFALLGVLVIIVFASLHLIIEMVVALIVLVIVYVGLFGIPYNNDGELMMYVTMLTRVGLHRRRVKKGLAVHVSDQPTDGENPTVSPDLRPAPAVLPAIGRIDFRPHRVGEKTMGVGFDLIDRTYAATFWTAGSSLQSAEEHAREQLLSGFSLMLDTVARSRGLIDSLKWRVQTFEGELLNPNDIVQALQEGANLSDRNRPGLDVFLKRTAEDARASVTHRCTFTLSINPVNAIHQVKRAGGPEKLLEQQLWSFLSTMMGAEGHRSPIGMKEVGVHSYNNLLFENRLALDPVATRGLWYNSLQQEHLLSQQVAWPESSNMKPIDHAWFGKTCHRCFYISEFTREGMLSDQFWNLLTLPVSKTFSAVFKMEDPEWSRKRQVLLTNAMEGNNRDRESKGIRVDAFRRRGQHEHEQREREMAVNEEEDGVVRCYIDMTGPNLEAVDAGSARLIDAGRSARFMINDLDYRQHLGISAILPNGRGIKGFKIPKTLKQILHA